MNNTQTENGGTVRSTDWLGRLKVERRVAPAPTGSERHELLTRAAAQWRLAGLDPCGSLAICENVARELEIERDTGAVVYLNRRIG